MVAVTADRPIDGGRDSGGRFTAGNKFSLGGQRTESLDAALRRIVDRDSLAHELSLIAHNRNHRDQIRAIEYIYNRLAGAPRQVLKLESDEADIGLLFLQREMARLRGEDVSSLVDNDVVNAEVRELPPGEVDNDAVKDSKVDNEAGKVVDRVEQD